MLNIIQKAYWALPQDAIDEEVSKIENKCKITWNIVNYKRDLMKENPCFANLEIILQTDKDYYKFNASGLWDEECTIDSIYEVFDRNIKIWEKLYVLADKDNRIISKNLYGYNKYDVKDCKSNYSEKEYKSDYLKKSTNISSTYYLIFWFIIFILIIIFYKMFLSKKKS
jgi:hypothetical protein